LNFLDRLFKNPPIPNFTKICSVGAELFHVVRWKDRQTWQNCHFLQFCKNTEKFQDYSEGL